MKKEHASQYTELIKKANPLFIHVKGYVALGCSKEKLGEKRMPTHREIKEFAEKIATLTERNVLGEKEESRVVLLGKDKKSMKIKKKEI